VTRVVVCVYLCIIIIIITTTTITNIIMIVFSYLLTNAVHSSTVPLHRFINYL
jgi:hypothetical protein